MQTAPWLPRHHFRRDISELDRLATLQFPLVILLTFFHNDRGGVFTERMQGIPGLNLVVDMLAYRIGGMRASVYFMIAGYAFFKAFTPTLAWFARKWKSRARTLLVPLVAWNALGLLTLAVAQQIPALSGLLTPTSDWGNPIADFSQSQFRTALLGAPHMQPLIYPLWFLRDLFTLMLLAPLLFVAIRTTHGWVTPLVAVCWVFGIYPPFVAEDALIFFIVGCHVSITRRSIFALDRFAPLAALIWIALEFIDSPVLQGASLHKLRVVVGSVTVLYLSGWLAGNVRLSNWATRGARYSFFIFAAHEPLLTFTRKATLTVLEPSQPLTALVVYVGGVLFVITTLIVAFEQAERHAPTLLSLLTGGRSLSDQKSRRTADLTNGQRHDGRPSRLEQPSPGA